MNFQCSSPFLFLFSEFVFRDANGWLGLIAPRPLLIATAYNDNAGDTTFAVEKNYLSGKKVYEFLNATDHLRVNWR